MASQLSDSNIYFLTIGWSLAVNLVKKSFAEGNGNRRARKRFLFKAHRSLIPQDTASGIISVQPVTTSWSSSPSQMNVGWGGGGRGSLCRHFSTWHSERSKLAVDSLINQDRVWAPIPVNSLLPPREFGCYNLPFLLCCKKPSQTGYLRRGRKRGN